MRICTIASGSSGNCTYVGGGGVHVLIDAGVSCRRITLALKELGLTPHDLSAVFITHEHSDHIAGLATLLKKCPVPLYAAPATLHCLGEKFSPAPERLRPLAPGQRLELGGMTVAPFPTSHDAAASQGYRVQAGGRTLALATDLGFVTEQVRRGVDGAEILICETNHDVDWLRSGPYPHYLQERILGDRGHLSNEAGADLAAWAVGQGTKYLILAHLSKENNTPARARQAVERRLRAQGLEPGRDVLVEVAGPDSPGRVFELEEKEAAVCSASI